MGIDKRKRSIADMRRRDIIEAARAVLEGHWIDTATMDEIARRAEYTKQTLYAYFPSKDELLIAVHLDRFRERWRFQQALMDAEDSAAGKLRAFGEGYFRYFTQHPSELQLMLYIDSKGLYFSETYKKLYRLDHDFLDGTEQYMHNVLRQGQAEGSLRRGLDLWWTLSYLYLSLRSVLNEAMMSKTISAAKREAIYDTFLDVLIQGLRPPRRKAKEAH